MRILLSCLCLAATGWTADLSAQHPPAAAPGQGARAGAASQPPATGSQSPPISPYARWNQPSGSPPAAAKTPPPAASTPAMPSAAIPSEEPIEGCEVIAKVDGQIVQACEILWQVDQVIEDNRAQIGPSQEEAVRRMLMQRQLVTLVDTKILYADFLRNVPNDRLDVIFKNLDEPFEEKQIPQLTKRFQADSPAHLEMKLHEMGSSLRDMRQAFREQALAGEWLRSKIDYSEEVTHDEMLDYYHQHEDQYEYPTQVRWEELMVRRNRFATRNEAIQAICEMGNAAYQKAMAAQSRGPIFTEIAKAESHGFTADEGGIQDWTTKGALKSSTIDSALFSLAVGQMSDVLESDGGFHIVRVLERKEAGRTPFTEVQADIADSIKQQRFLDERLAYLEKMRESARIWTIFTGDTSYEKLANPTGPPMRR